MSHRFTLLCLLLAALLAVPGCRRNHHGESQALPAGTISMSDPDSARQLVSGFYGIEAGAWRWTAAKFSINFGIPSNAASNGAVLKLGVTIPDVVIQKLNEVTLMAKLGDTQLPPQTFDKSGAYIYEQIVPALAFHGTGQVIVDFWLDKVIPPGSADSRQLGIIVNSFGLDSRSPSTQLSPTQPAPN